MQRLAREHQQKPDDRETKKEDDKEKKKEPKLVLPQLAKVEMRSYKPGNLTIALCRKKRRNVCQNQPEHFLMKKDSLCCPWMFHWSY